MSVVLLVWLALCALYAIVSLYGWKVSINRVQRSSDTEEQRADVVRSLRFFFQGGVGIISLALPWVFFTGLGDSNSGDASVVAAMFFVSLAMALVAPLSAYVAVLMFAPPFARVFGVRRRDLLAGLPWADAGLLGGTNLMLAAWVGMSAAQRVPASWAVVGAAAGVAADIWIWYVTGGVGRLRPGAGRPPGGAVQSDQAAQ